MKVALDIRTLTSRRSGVGNYVLRLAQGLESELGAANLSLLAQPANLAAWGAPVEPARLIPTDISHENHLVGDAWEHAVLPGMLRRAGVEVFHGPAVMIPLAGRGFGRVATIHDLVAFLHAETIPLKYGLYMRWLLKRVVARADHLISVSHSTKDDLVRVLGVDEAKITVVHEAADARFRPHAPDEIARVRAKYGLEGPYLLHLGNLEPRKNLVRLVRAFLAARPGLDPELKLVLSGQEGWLTAGIRRDLPSDPQGLVCTGYLDHDDVPPLMAGALAFMFPSLYEGFGLPVVEAMASGTPVLTSNLSSLPEIAGDAALLVDPTDTAALTRGIQALAGDAELRRELTGRGLARARDFSWQRAAAQTRMVYEKVWEKQRRTA